MIYFDFKDLHFETYKSADLLFLRNNLRQNILQKTGDKSNLKEQLFQLINTNDDTLFLRFQKRFYLNDICSTVDCSENTSDFFYSGIENRSETTFTDDRFFVNQNEPVEHQYSNCSVKSKDKIDESDLFVSMSEVENSKRTNAETLNICCDKNLNFNHLKHSSKFKYDFPLYFKIKLNHLHKYRNTHSDSYNQNDINIQKKILNNHDCNLYHKTYADFYLELYDHEDHYLGHLLVLPNINIMVTEEIIASAGISIKDISYLKFAVRINEQCKFNLDFLTFSFVDFMSTHLFIDRAKGIRYRLKVNNLKKKKNGVIIFFPSFYVQERDADSNGSNAVKWPNYTRYTWSRDLEQYCTIFVSDPFQFINSNTHSSWFIAPDGNTVLYEIAEQIKNILGLSDNCLNIILNKRNKKKKFANNCDSNNNSVYGSVLLNKTETVSNNLLSEYIVYEKNISSNSNGFSLEWLHKLSDKLYAVTRKLRTGNERNCGPIINYGSSMGGYAAFLFSCYLKPDLCFAECPQANLTKYKYSLEYLKQYPEIDYKNDQYDCLSFSKIIQKHKPEFKSLFHFYALDRLHLDNFNNEISQLTDEEIKKFNYSLVIENDVENGLSGHQAMPKEKVLKIFHKFLKR